MNGRTVIVALGDSTTAGTPGWKSPRELPPSGSGDVTSQYAHWLMQARPEWMVVNQGVDGERSDQIRGRFAADVIEQSPRAVVIIAGVNDVYQGLEPQHVIDQLVAMYDRARQTGIAVVAGTIVPFNTARPEQNARMREINDWIRTFTLTANRVAFADTRASVAASDNEDLLFESPDNLHPSPAGYRRMAETIEPALRRVLG
jgi:lysophospholipase L1-like esterase